MINKTDSHFLFLFFLLLFSTAASSLYGQGVRIGAEVLIDKHLDLLTNKRVGIICNHTSVLPNGIHLVDTLQRLRVNITSLFAPEHGIRGNIPAGEKIENQKDSTTGLPIYSLYGGTRKPSIWMLHDVDVLIFDMQDVGARFYTYASTMAYSMMAAAEYGKKFIVLDRPNPINGVDIEGPMMDLTLISFVGLFPIPVRHGLTIGELAKMIAGEGYINPSNVDLTVIPMENWQRTMWYDETGLPWIAPSPNMKTLSTATVYPGTCLFEATNISEGRGTVNPFEYVGAPRLNKTRLANKLNELNLPGVIFSPIEFTPTTDSARATNPKYENKQCKGVFVQVTDRTNFKPVLTGIMMIAAIQELYPKKIQIKKGLLDRLIGDEIISEKIFKRKVSKNILDIFSNQISQFEKNRSKYLLY
ncbi:MAG: DUF1343 domain-containing protein [Bacteroidota bacterium]|nr:DUF1343 domain-containing protein [Bacteroidota bacterium]